MRYLLLFLALLSSPLLPGQAIAPLQWQNDIRYFSEQLVKRHKNAFHNVTKSEFDADISKLLADVHSLPDYQVIVRLLQVTAKIGDGHTAVHVPSVFKWYPVALSWFGDSLYVTASNALYQKALGSRLIGIDGLGLDEIKRRMATVVSQNENKWFDFNTSAAHMMRPEILVTAGIAREYGHATFTFLTDLDEKIEIVVTPLPLAEITWIPATKDPPLFRQKQRDPFWFVYLKDINAVFLSFKNYDDLGARARKLFAFIDSTRATRLIVDLRFNGGGDFKKGRRLLIEPIQELAKINLPGNLFVITGRRTFSAAMVNSIDFKKLTNALIVGEPPGERPNSYSENDEMTLPNSRLVISYSTEYYKFLDEDVPAFEPDVRIDPDWVSFKAGRDPVLEWIVSKSGR